MDHPHRAASTLVTSLAWIFIVLAGFAMLVCVTEYLLVRFSFPAGTRTLAQVDGFGDFGRHVLEHLRLLLIAMLGLFAVSLGAAVGLLKRAKWARILFIGLMVVGTFWNTAGAVLTYYFMPEISDQSDASQIEVAQWTLLRNMALLFNFLVSIASLVLFGWIIQRLGSDEVRREFQPHDD